MKVETKSEYDIQAEKFVKLTGITIDKVYTGHRKHFYGDKENRSCWNIVVTAPGRKSFSYDFGQSIKDSYKTIRNWGPKEIKKAPSDYDLLACMSSDSYQSDSLEGFCGDFGYDTYLACEKISSNINRFFSADELEQLREIQ
jgi:hypothetical protein